MSEIRAFRAASMQEALAIVRRELGGDAVILQTRQVAKRRLLPWMKQRVEFEVVAGVPAAETAAQSDGENAPYAAAINNTAGRTPAQQTAELPRTPNSLPPGTPDGLPPESVLADAAFPRQQDLSQFGIELGRPSDEHNAAGPSPGEPLAECRDIPLEGIRGDDKLAYSTNGTAAQPRLTPTDAAAAVAAAGDASLSDPALAAKLDSIQQMLLSLAQTRGGEHATEIPDELFQIYTDLIDSDVDEAVARRLVLQLRRECPPDLWKDSAAVMTTLSAMVESHIRCQGPIVLTPGQRKVVALVGPTGVGKTTTIAKLAANFRLRDGIRMGLVTVDTYRIAAVEQLRTYAEIIDLPMSVVTSPREMRRSIQEMESLDLVLIDTAGRSPRDELQIQELKSLLAEASVDEVHLVLSLTSSLRAIRAAAEKFATAKTTSLVLTKLDEAAGLGSLLSVAQQVDLPLSYLTTGQDVPDDIESANSSRIARLVLGQEKLHSGLS